MQPFTHDFPRADIYEILTLDLLHQIIKGTFKDHLVTWIGKYLTLEHGEAGADKIMDDIDRRWNSGLWKMAKARSRVEQADESEPMRSG